MEERRCEWKTGGDEVSLVKRRVRGERGGRIWGRRRGWGGEGAEVEAVHFLLASHLNIYPVKTSTTQ